jgi:hypothetical protein
MSTAPVTWIVFQLATRSSEWPFSTTDARFTSAEEHRTKLNSDAMGWASPGWPTIPPDGKNLDVAVAGDDKTVVIDKRRSRS